GPAANAYVVDAVPAKERGAAFGWLGSSISAGFMMGPALGGLMVDAFGYASPFIFGGVAPLSTAVFLAIKMTNRKPGERSQMSVEEGAPIEEAKSRRQIPRSLFVPGLVAVVVF